MTNTTTSRNGSSSSSNNSNSRRSSSNEHGRQRRNDVDKALYLTLGMAPMHQVLDSYPHMREQHSFDADAGKVDDNHEHDSSTTHEQQQEQQQKQQDTFAAMVWSCWGRSYGPSKRYLRTLVKRYIRKIGDDHQLQSEHLLRLVYDMSTTPTTTTDANTNPISITTIPNPDETCYLTFPIQPMASSCSLRRYEYRSSSAASSSQPQSPPPPEVTIRIYPYHNDVALRLWEAGATLAEYIWHRNGCGGARSNSSIGNRSTGNKNRWTQPELVHEIDNDTGLRCNATTPLLYHDDRVVELGAGVGVTSLIAAAAIVVEATKASVDHKDEDTRSVKDRKDKVEEEVSVSSTRPPPIVVATDYTSAAIENLAHNRILNESWIQYCKDSSISSSSSNNRVVGHTAADSSDCYERYYTDLSPEQSSTETEVNTTLNGQTILSEAFLDWGDVPDGCTDHQSATIASKDDDHHRLSGDTLKHECLPGIRALRDATVLLAADVAYDVLDVPSLVRTIHYFLTTSPTTSTTAASTATANKEKCIEVREKKKSQNRHKHLQQHQREKRAYVATTFRNRVTFETLQQELEIRKIRCTVVASGEDCATRLPRLFPTKFHQPRSDVQIWHLTLPSTASF